MKITVRLFATLREGRGKELNLETLEHTTPRDLMTRLSIPESEVAILLVNGRDGRADGILEEGDRVSLFPPVGGG
ncbi:MAG: MoaD/ThiS family protein [Treponemataceae bacterium]